MSKANDQRNFYNLPVQERHDLLVDAYSRAADLPKDAILHDLQKQTGGQIHKAYRIILNDVCGWLGIQPDDIDTVASLEEKVGEAQSLWLDLSTSNLPYEIDKAFEDLYKKNTKRLNDPAFIGTDRLSVLQHEFYKAFVTDNEAGINQTLCDLILHYATLEGAQRLAILAQAKTTLYGENADDVTAKFLAAAHTREGAIKDLSLELQVCLKDTKTYSSLDDIIEYAAELSHGEDHMLEAVIGVITAKIKILDHPMPEPQVGIDLTHWIPKGPLN